MSLMDAKDKRIAELEGITKNLLEEIKQLKAESECYNSENTSRIKALLVCMVPRRFVMKCSDEVINLYLQSIPPRNEQTLETTHDNSRLSSATEHSPSHSHPFYPIAAPKD